MTEPGQTPSMILVRPTTGVDPSLLVRRIRELLHEGRLAAARPLLAALRLVAPDAGTTDELDAELLLREGRTAEALSCLDRALAAAPRAVTLLLCRADARLRANDLRGAASDAAEAVVLAPQEAQPKAILGIILTALDETTDAVACLTEALGQEPGSPSFRQALAHAQERAGDNSGAAATLQDGIGRMPGNVALRIAAIMVAMRQRDFDAAIRISQSARSVGVADACIFGLLGHALSNVGQHEPAAEAYREALKLAPQDEYVAHLVRAAGGLSNADRAPNGYVETVFDGYAARFEAHLIGLGYRVPGLIRAALLAHLPNLLSETAEIGPVLDLGCGTGLLGVALSDLPLRPLIGVDISSIMLQQAASKNLYAELLHADLETVLADAERDWALVIAGDVLCYFGELDRLFTAIRRRLRPGGLCVFSVELLPHGGKPWELTGRGRYAHAVDYVAGAAADAGLIIRELRDEGLRREDDQDVAGLLAVLQRAPC